MNIIRGIAYIIVFTFLFVATVSQATAAPLVSPSSLLVPSPSVTPEPIQYVLPYPGLLPTHPLYFIKNIRDKIIELLVTDPISKSEFYILQADKKLNMGVTLENADKKYDADAVLAEALAARTKAVETLILYKTSKNDVPGYLVDKLLLSIQKHGEVLHAIGKKSDEVETLGIKAEKITP